MPCVFLLFMKRILLGLILSICCVLSTFAQAQWYRTTGFATANVYNGQYHWGNWEASNIRICIDKDVITVYSPKTQIYAIYDTYNNGQMYYDNGGKQVKFYAIDQDYDKCTIRLRIENNGNSQIYIDFSNVAWVYNVVRI